MISRTLNHLRLRLHSSMFDAVFAPRKPRHPLLKLAIGLVGLALLAVLLVFGVVIGIGMLAIGLAARLLRHSRSPQPASHGNALDGEFRVVDKPLLR